MNAEKKAMLQMVVCAALWSIAGLFIKLIDLNPFAIAGMRSLFAAATVLVFMLLRHEKIRLTRNVAISAFFLAATFFAFVSANKLTTAANTIVLQFTAPIFVILLAAVFWRKKPGRLDLTACALVQGPSGDSVTSDVPEIIPFSLAQSMAS